MSPLKAMKAPQALTVLALLAFVSTAHALPRAEQTIRYYSDATLKKVVGSTTLRCSGKLTSRGRATEFEKEIAGRACSTGSQPPGATTPCIFRADPTCTRLPGSP